MKKITDLEKRILLLLATEMDMPDLLHFCSSSKYIDNNVCEDDEIWIIKLKRDYDFIFLGKSSEDRNPKKYYQILYNPASKINIEYGNTTITYEKIKEHKYQHVSIFDAIKNNYIDLVKFLTSRIGEVHCSMIYLAVEYKRLEIVKYLFDNYKITNNNIPYECIKNILMMAVSFEDESILSIILNNTKDIYNNGDFPEDVILKAIDMKNYKALTLLKEYYFKNRHLYLDEVLNSNDMNLLKSLYDENIKKDISSEISRTIHSDNVEFFKYLISIVDDNTIDDKIEYDDYTRERMDRIKKYDTTWYRGYLYTMTNKELYYISKYLFHVVRNNIKILEYFTSFKAVKDYLYYEKNI